MIHSLLMTEERSISQTLKFFIGNMNETFWSGTRTNYMISEKNYIYRQLTLFWDYQVFSTKISGISDEPWARKEYILGH